MRWIGIDPGLDGALALIDGDAVDFVDMPTITLQGAKKSHRELDLHQIIAAIKGWSSEGQQICIAIERQQAMPATLNGRQQGGVSTFRTGMGYGMLIGMLETLGVPYELVAPVSWKSKIMADSPKDKDASRTVARRLFPLAAPHLNLKKHHGRADALLIAEFARRRRAS